MHFKKIAYQLLELVAPSVKTARLKEAAEITHIYNKSTSELESLHCFIRTSTFDQISNVLINFEAKNILNTTLRSKYENQLNELRKQRNKTLRLNNLEFAKSLFNSENGNSSLNEEQLDAVAADEDNNLIIAGAGSGKTTVIAHKVKYLVEKGVSPKDILLLSFTKASAQSLNEKIQKKMAVFVEATTLHSFAYSTYKNANINIQDITDEKKLFTKVYEALMETLSKRNYLRFFLEFYNRYFYDIKPLVYYKNIQELRTDLKKIDAKIDDQLGCDHELELRKKFLTLKGELVRSVDERYVADFLFIHGIKYEYEKKYELVTYDYYPDFYLIDYDIYLEHFAIDKNGNAPLVFDNPKKYVENIQIKRDLHKKMGTKLIETLTWQLNDQGSDEYLLRILSDVGIVTKNIDTSVVDLISRKFNQFISTFYTRLKLSGKNLEDLKRSTIDLPYKIFFSFYEGFQSEFEKIKMNENLTDFNDLLKFATEIYRKGNGQSYKYIIVDEFQDTSWIAMRLLNAVFESSPGASFYMVGDDWQSIYGFNGSDVNILAQFKNRTGCEVKYLNKNYRSHQNIVQLGKKFIERNEQQLKKDSISANQVHKTSEIKFLYINELENQIRKINKNETIFLLGRYNNDEPVSLINILFEDGYKKLKFMTIHKSKGLEATHIFILFPNELKRDFPSLIQDHYIFNILKTNTETFAFAEERRLMYVAMTRAEKNLYFVSPYEHRKPNSDFWSEIEDLVPKLRSSDSFELSDNRT